MKTRISGNNGDGESNLVFESGFKPPSEPAAFTLASSSLLLSLYHCFSCFRAGFPADRGGSR